MVSARDVDDMSGTGLYKWDSDTAVVAMANSLMFIHESSKS